MSPGVSAAAAAYVAYLTNLVQKSSDPEDKASSQQACLRLDFRKLVHCQHHLYNRMRLLLKRAYEIYSSCINVPQGGSLQ